MRSCSVFGLLIACLVATGCFESKPASPAPKAEIVTTPSSPNRPAERDIPSNDLADTSDLPNDPPDDVVSQPIQTESDVQPAERTQVEDDSSLKEMAASVGRVLFVQSGDAAGGHTSGQSQTGEKDQRSVLGAVGRALSKAAIEAAKQPTPEE